MEESPTLPEPVLEITGLSVSFGSGTGAVPVTWDVDLSINKGETLALVGESGSGKSVTAMSILGLLPANATRTGSVKFQGRELLGLPERELDKIRGGPIATIFQDPMTALNPVYKIGDLMAEAMRKLGLSPKQQRRRAIDLLKQVGIPEPESKIDQYPHQFSGGQRQRAMIAIAVSSDPLLLVADEPTTALDVTVQAEILDLLLDLQSQNGMALLLITHDMGVVADVADRVEVMREGVVVETAPTADLFESPKHDYTRQLLAAVPHLGHAATPTSRPQAIDAGVPAALSFKNVDIEYRHGAKSTFKAVDDVSFDVLQGEVVGLVGESGSGKSTLGKLAVGLLRPAAGHARVAGVDLSTAKKTELRQARRKVTMVFQDPASSLNPRETIGDSIVAPLRWHRIENNSRALNAKAGELLELVRIPASWAGRFPHELSGGQRQRIGVARALALNPSLMIADEPTSALDVSVQATVLDLLQELQAELGFSCLFISHDLSVIEQLADRVVVLRRGRVVEQGITAEVLNHPQVEYTRSLIAAAPVPDPVEQAQRRKLRLALA